MHPLLRWFSNALLNLYIFSSWGRLKKISTKYHDSVFLLLLIKLFLSDLNFEHVKINH